MIVEADLETWNFLYTPSKKSCLKMVNKNNARNNTLNISAIQKSQIVFFLFLRMYTIGIYTPKPEINTHQNYVFPSSVIYYMQTHHRHDIIFPGVKRPYQCYFVNIQGFHIFSVTAPWIQKQFICTNRSNLLSSKPIMTNMSVRRHGL